jgi:hypothetical protein
VRIYTRICPARVTSSPAHPGDNADTVRLYGFRVADPSGREQEERETLMRKVTSRMAPPRMFRMGTDGAMHEVEINDLF